MSLKEFIVTLHKHEDLDSFYEDMETPGGNLYIPDRAVEVVNRRPISRNTHYWLTAEEADQIKQDPRVWDVSLTPEELGLVSLPGWTDTNGYYSKNTVTTANDRNWGILRGFDRDHVDNWGSDGATKVRNSSPNSKLDGTNVDFVIRGYTVDTAAPEFAVNSDGTGGSRYFYVNWGDYGLGGTYTQAALTYNRSGAHETLCGSIAFGNTQGWARKARFTSIPNNTTYYDYVRAWHQAKNINPDTGFKNPTIVTDSYGDNYGINATAITSIVYRGTTYNGPFTTSTDFSQYKLWLNNSGETLYGQPDGRVVFSYTSAANRADIEDLVAAGVIFVGISHNWRAYHAVENDQDWNNTITFGGGTFYYNRGLFASATGAIQTGAIMDLAANTPSPRSGRGPRVDIWAPSRTTGYSFYAGETPDGTGLGYEGGVQTDPASQGYLPMIQNSRDTRNSNYYIVKTTDGTSFSAPQVAGVIGLWAELKPNITPSEALTYLQTYGDSTGVVSTSNNYGDPTSLAGATALALGFSPPTFSISANKSSLQPNDIITYTIATTNVPTGSTVYLVESGTSEAGDFVDGATQAPITTTGDTTLVVRTVSSNFTGSKTSILQVKTGGYNGTVQATNSTVTISGATGEKFNRYDSTVINYLQPPGAFGSATANEVSRAGYQLLRSTQKTHPWRAAGLSETQTIASNISYLGDGRYVDLIVADNGTWAGHSEFINRNMAIPNVKNPTNYIGGNVLPGNGYSDILDVILDGPYYIDPDWFNADPANRLMDRWDNTRVPVEQVARDWWRASANRSAKFASIGNVVIPDYYTRLSVYGSNTQRCGDSNGGHGTQCSAQAYGRTLGWAFNANKWVINQIGNSSCGFQTGFDVTKIFHQNKPINPVFGTRDPTVSSNSWGFRAIPNSAGFGIYRGTAYQYSDDTTKPHFMRYVGDAGDAGRMKGEMIPNSITVAGDELINSGVIVLVAAGNSTQQLVKSTHPNYNNYWTTDANTPLNQTLHFAFGYTFRNTTNRRGFPQHLGKYTADGQVVYPVIQVGALDDLFRNGLEAKVNYSDMGEDIDCYAPGDGTWAASVSGFGNVRYDFTYPAASLVSYDTRFSGTSSACPTAAGIIASKLATNRSWTWQNVKAWLNDKVGVVSSSDFYDPGEVTDGNSVAWADLNNPQGSALRVIWDAPTTDESIPIDTQLVIATVSLTVGQSGISIRPVIAQGGIEAARSYSISPSLPSGLSFNSATGFITGNANAASGSTSYTVTATDGTSSSSKSFTLSVVNFSITAAANQTFTENQVITPFIIASTTGGVSPFSYSITSSNLPTGLTLNSSTGEVSGAPNEQITTRTINVRVTDSNSVSKTGSFTITVNAAGPAPVISITSSITNNTFSAGKDRISNQETVTVTNTGNVPVTISSIIVSTNGSVSPTIDYTSWGSPTNLSINVGQSKSFAIRFTGANVGTFSNTITIDAVGTSDEVINITNNVAAQVYAITPNKTSTTEAGEVTFTIATTNYGSGVLYWKNVGTTRAGDFINPIIIDDDTILEGNVQITSDAGSFTLNLDLDRVTEGTETIIIELYSDQAFTDLLDTSDTVTVIDSSTDEIPVYTIQSNAEEIDEGDTVVFYISTTVVDEGVSLYWTNEGTTSGSDFTDSLEYGEVNLSSYVNLLYRTVSLDYTSESRETIIIALRSGSITGPILTTSSPVYVRDTSQSPTATYSMVSDKSTMDEGETANFTVTTTNLLDRTVLYWTTRGDVDRDDFKDNKLTGSFKIVNNEGAFRRTLKNDIKTEPPETFVIELRKKSIYGPVVDEFSITINDTSITPPVDPEPPQVIVPGQGTNLGKLNARVPIIIRLP
jgi:hypothetical protein